jgi:WASH complex subunit 7
VNFTFQFLRQKFVVFSQFLYDDHIKSRLYKDVRFFKENKDKLDSKYPLDRAETFNKEIRKLGLADDGSSYLDAFRVLITEIGNAMGYIRMVRSGGLYYTFNSIKFVPDLQDIVKFEDLVSSEGLAPTTAAAGRNLDNALNNLAKNFSEGVDYFKILIKAFAPEFRNENHIHLKNFHVIIPPLTLNFVNYMLTTKDKLMTTRKGQIPSYCFCDDGFAIGVAYILKLLDQNTEFDSLHWFESVVAKFTAENAKLAKLVDLEKRGVKRMSKEQQTAQLTLKKNELYLREFELLRYSLSGARIFFKNE